MNSSQTAPIAIGERAAVLAATALKKEYETGFRVGPIDLILAPGETVALLGKNGAGKTTLFQVLTGNADATGGTVSILGRRLTPDTPDVKRAVGYLPQNPALPRWATGRDLLTYAAKLHGLPERERLIAEREAYWDTASYRKKPLATLSYGMQKRLGLALATLHDPPLLILDEPFSGLDLYHIRAVEDAIQSRAAAAKATLVSTHDAANAARTAHRALVMDAGQLTLLEGFAAAGFLERMALIENAFFGNGTRA